MIVTLGSIRGAPGVTSWALLLGAAWPADIAVERVVLEADPSGGVLGSRYGWGVDPGVVSLVASLRHQEGRAIALGDHARRIDARLWVVTGSESAERARPVLLASSAELAARVEVDARVWLVDVGRLEDGNPSVAFVERSALSVLLCGGRPEDLVQLPTRVGAVRERGSHVAVLVTGPCSYSPSDVAAFAMADAAWQASPDSDLRETTAAVLNGSRRARRGLVWRQAIEVAASVAELAYRCAPQDPAVARLTEEVR